MNILFINHDLPGVPRESAVGLSIYKFALPGQLDLMKNKLEGVLKSGEPTTYNIAYPVPEKGEGYFLVHVTPVLKKAKVTALVLNTTNITEQKQIEFKLKESKEAAEKFSLELKQTQSQLLEKERLATLGNLIATVN